jgi:hypothetical protein
VNGEEGGAPVQVIIRGGEGLTGSAASMSVRRQRRVARLATERLRRTGGSSKNSCFQSGPGAGNRERGRGDGRIQGKGDDALPFPVKKAPPFFLSLSLSRGAYLGTRNRNQNTAVAALNWNQKKGTGAFAPEQLLSSFVPACLERERGRGGCWLPALAWALTDR